MCDCNCEDCDVSELTERLDALENQAVGGRKVAQKSLQRTSTLEDQLEAERERNQDLVDRVAALENVLSALESKPYDSLTKQEKVARVRKYLIDRAGEKSSRKHTLTYDDVQWGVFDGEPSDGHCYQLMKDASKETGFTHTTDPHRVAVDLDEANDQTGRSLVNNAIHGEGV